MNEESAAPHAVIFGCAGMMLSAAERDFFEATNPLGFILFARNCHSPAQVRALTKDLRACVGRADAPVLIDQEGGRVARLRPPHWRAAPPAARFGALALNDPARAEEAVRLNGRLLAWELAALGISVDCAPVLDVPTPAAHEVIGDRAFGRDPHLCARLGRALCEGLLAGGVLPVIKHIPGHGRATADSHTDLPVVEAAHADLAAVDFVAFRELADMPWAMTAHILYTALDERRVATLSDTVIERIIRNEIGYDGLLVSDDLSMKALPGSLGERAERALAAGCDVVLHCNGKAAEMQEVAAAVGSLDAPALDRLARGADAVQSPGAFDFDAGCVRLAELLGTEVTQ